MNCVVTGINRGIGLELCKQLLERGETVWGLSRHPEAEALAQLKNKFKDRLHIVKGDVTSDADVRKFAEQVSAVDLLINNAGVLLDSEFDFPALSLKKVADTFEVNVYAPMRMIQAFLGKLQKSQSPFVLNITSKMGSIEDNSSGGYYAYRMSKTALNMFNKSFSIDYPQITSIVAHPGWVQTDMGGAGATTAAKESAAGLLNLFYERGRGMSGKFFDYQGRELPW